MKIIKPNRLQKGDAVGIIAPADALLNKQALKRGVKVLENFGFKVVLGKNLLKRHSDSMAGTDEERASDLNEMFADKKIKGIFCLRGGSTSNRLLPLIDFDNIKKNPKVFVGFSDITTLIIAIHIKTGLVTFHGPNVTTPAFLNEYTQKSLFKLITQPTPLGKIEKRTKWKILKKGSRKEVRGKLIGGNLEILLHLSGTEYFPAFDNSIFFWEEFAEPSENIDLFLMHLRLAKAMEKMKGMVIGKVVDFDKYSEYKRYLSLPQIVKEITKPYDFPIVMDADFGHVLEFFTLPIGINAKLDSCDASLEILESAVI